MLIRYRCNAQMNKAKYQRNLQLTLDFLFGQSTARLAESYGLSRSRVSQLIYNCLSDIHYAKLSDQRKKDPNVSGKLFIKDLRNVRSDSEFWVTEILAYAERVHGFRLDTSAES